ncbi:MAG: porin [Acidobacteriota bacterium]|nr:porin [Acidobacteriota bacterium]
MRLPLCILALAFSAWAADIDTAQPIATPDQTSAPAPQTPAAPDSTKPADTTPPAKYDGWVFSALADGYITANFNHPYGSSNQLQNFDINYGQAELSLAKVTIDKSDKVLGIHIDAGFGETMRLIHAADRAAQNHRSLRYIEQAYLILKPNHFHGTEIDFGQFVTSAGAEVIEAPSNWNYSRSLLFALAIPYFHDGFRTSTPITKTWSAGIQVVDAWNTTWGNNNLKNIGVTSAVTTPKFTWSANYYEGPNHVHTTAGKRNLIDSTLLLTPNSKFNVYINADYGRDNHIFNSGHDSWYGVAGAVRIQLAKKFAITPRAEIYDDATGFTTGTKQVLKEGTITGEYKHNDHFIARAEFRHDASDHKFFNRSSPGQPLTTSMNTVTLGLMAILGPLK